MIFTIVVVLLVGFFLYHQSNRTDSNPDVRKIAWNHISKNEMPHIVGTWKDATVIKRQLKQYGMKTVYIVSFPTNDNPTVGDYVIYLDIDTKKFLGIGLRD